MRSHHNIEEEKLFFCVYIVKFVLYELHCRENKNRIQGNEG